MPPLRLVPLKGPLALLLLLLLASGFAQNYYPLNPQVRVLLAVAPSTVVKVDGAHNGSLDGTHRFRTAAPLEWPVQAEGSRLYVDGAPVGRRLLLEPESGIFEHAGNRYRGAVVLTAIGGEVEVVNVVDLDSYLRGVVPSEMSATWPAEALKAQAVAARSYTLASLNPSGRYDLCATDECQVYRGVAVEHPRTDEAIRATAGMVVTYDGSIARTYYHSDSGGKVASSREVWGSALPYLITLSDATTVTPHRAWVKQLDTNAVSNSLTAAGYRVGTVSSLRVTRVSESGRVAELEVVGNAGSRVIGGTALTRLLRGWGLKSTRFTVVGGLTVQGDGWGHGVGMSQYGARALALSGYDFGRILAFYYPTTSLTRYVSDGR